jgi:hypothetical protein
MDHRVPGRCNSGDSKAVFHTYTLAALRDADPPCTWPDNDTAALTRPGGSAMHNPQHYYYSPLKFKLLSRGAPRQ